ncbi:MAG: hypothetical protein L3J33_03355 [Rhodobacteraceae bacterium]|nr:hypothetical protein [Paracoccaceae bacterium]
MKRLFILGAALALPISILIDPANAGSLVTVVPYEPNISAPVAAAPPAYSWSGASVGIHGGKASGSRVTEFSERIYETVTRDVIEDQCWKWWRADWWSQVDDRYCTGGFGGMSQHVFANARSRDFVIGTEEYEQFLRTDYWSETVTADMLAYGVQAGYLQDFGAFAIGAEAGYTWLEGNALGIDGLAYVQARAGIAVDRLFIYGTAGQGWASNGESGFVYGGGIDVAIGERLVIGVAYQQYDLPDTPIGLATLRASIKF